MSFIKWFDYLQLINETDILCKLDWAELFLPECVTQKTSVLYIYMCACVVVCLQTGLTVCVTSLGFLQQIHHGDQSCSAQIWALSLLCCARRSTDMGMQLDTRSLQWWVSTPSTYMLSVRNKTLKTARPQRLFSTSPNNWELFKTLQQTAVKMTEKSVKMCQVQKGSLHLVHSADEKRSSSPRNSIKFSN